VETWHSERDAGISAVLTIRASGKGVQNALLKTVKINITP
jgi:hypothetical protein